MEKSSKEFPRSRLRKIGIGALVITVLIIIGAVQYISEWSMFCDDPVTVNAVITGNDQRHYRGRTEYLPYLTYECRGQEYTVCRYDGRSQPYPVGAVMTITVDGSDPKRILEEPEGEKLFVLIILGLTFSAMSAAAFIQMKNTDE